MRRPLAAGAVGVAIAVAVTGCGSNNSSSSSSSGSGDKPSVSIMVGGIDKQIYLSAMLTEKLGYFDQEGVDVKLSDEPAGVDAENQLVAGKVDGVVGFYDHTIDLQAKGKSMESVVQLLRVPGEVELCGNDVKSQISSPADWSGKRLGVTGLGSSTNFLSQALAQRKGVDPKTITPVAVKAGATFVAALQHKAIDCGMTTEPTVSTVLSKNLGYVLVDLRSREGAEQSLGGLYPASCLYMKSDYVASHKDVVQKLVNAFVRTQHWIASHSAADITSKLPSAYYAGVGKDAYVKALDQEKDIFTPDGVMPDGGPQTVLQVLSGFDPNIQGKKIDLSKTYTTEFAQKANQSIS